MTRRIIEHNGKTLIEDGQGGWREPTSDELGAVSVDSLGLPEPMAQAVDEAFSPEMGVTLGQRLVVKNLTKDLESAERYLSSLGYEVKRYRDPSITTPMPLWVRKGQGDPWKPVDPEGASPSEAILDILDLTADAVNSFLTATAGAGGFAAGGPLGGLAAGGAVNFLGERARQGLGSMLGVPDNMSLQQQAMAGVAGGAMSALPVPKAPVDMGGYIPGAKPGLVTRGLRKLNANIAGTTPELMQERVKVKGFQGLGDPHKSIKDIRSLLESLEFDSATEQFGVRLPPRVEADEIVKAAGNPPVDLEPMFAKLAQFTQMTTTDAGRKIRVDPNIPTLARRIYKNFSQSLAADGHSIRAVPADVAEDVVRDLQAIARSKMAYKNVEVTKPAASVVSSVAREASRAVKSAVDATGATGPTGKTYTETMADLDALMTSLGKVRKGFYRGKDEIEQLRTAEGTMKMLHGDLAGQEYVAALRDLDRAMGTDLAEPARLASMGMKFGETFGAQGKPNPVPRLTVQGRLMGTNLVGPAPGPMAYGGGAGFLAAGPLGAAMGAAFASPAVQLALAKAGPMAAAGYQELARTGAGMGPRMATIDALNQAVRDLGRDK